MKRKKPWQLGGQVETFTGERTKQELKSEGEGIISAFKIVGYLSLKKLHKGLFAILNSQLSYNRNYN